MDLILYYLTSNDNFTDCLYKWFENFSKLSLYFRFSDQSLWFVLTFGIEFLLKRSNRRMRWSFYRVNGGMMHVAHIYFSRTCCNAMYGTKNLIFNWDFQFAILKIALQRRWRKLKKVQLYVSKIPHKVT